MRDIFQNKQHDCTVEILLTACSNIKNTFLKKFLDLLQSMMPICSTGIASKSCLFAL